MDLSRPALLALLRRLLPMRWLQKQVRSLQRSGQRLCRHWCALVRTTLPWLRSPRLFRLAVMTMFSLTFAACFSMLAYSLLRPSRVSSLLLERTWKSLLLGGGAMGLASVSLIYGLLGSFSLLWRLWYGPLPVNYWRIARLHTHCNPQQGGQLFIVLYMKFFVMLDHFVLLEDSLDDEEEERDPIDSQPP